MTPRVREIMAHTIAGKCANDCIFVGLSETMPMVSDHMLDIMAEIYKKAYEQGYKDAKSVGNIEFTNTERKYESNV